MDDLGAPISYVVLEEGTPIYSSDEVRVGAVGHVLAAVSEDIFDGIIIGQLERDVFAPAHGHRFIDAADVGPIYERGVTLTITATACRALHEPRANPMDADPTRAPVGPIADKLHRAWDLLSGKY